MDYKSKIQTVKKITAALLAALIVFVQSPLVSAQTAPTPPSAPTAPPAPENEEEPPSAPPAPENTEEPPSAPTPPPAPDSSDTQGADSSSSGGSGTSGQDQGTSSDPESQNSGEGEVGGSSSGGGGIVGDTQIETGDAANTAVIANDLNSNFSAAGSGSSGSGGINVVNKDNGRDSENTGSVTLAEDKLSIQDNSATLVNNLAQATNTGENTASKNVGDSSIETGDANTSGAIVNAVNTNIDGVKVYEFNVVDDHLGDIVLDLSSGCILGCGGGDILAENSGNASDSQNTAQVDSATNNAAFQTNDATVANNMTLNSNSGDNTADKNTGGDSTIQTGDANVSANVLNFANNNLVGGVIYMVVNVFGDLLGDIIFPEGACCFGSATAKNSGNGSDSTNTAEINQTVNNDTFQFNEANIENNLVFDANTGGNTAVKNTNANSSIETGDTSVEGQVVNVANTNISGGNWWLVIVNEAGRWIGKILGAGDGVAYAGSDGFEFIVNEAGEITVTNSGNGSGSTNTGTVNQETNNTIVQDNTANIVNNVNLSANTGGNSASRNTGGDSSIQTGDANIIANIVNFVNNNIVGGGTLFVTVVNVFGSWIGDFVGPGYTKEPEPPADASSNGNPGVGGMSEESNPEHLGSHSNLPAGEAESDLAEAAHVPSPTPYFAAESLLPGARLEGGSLTLNDADSISYSGGGLGFDTETGARKVININLAWLFVVLIPGYFVLALARRRRTKRLSAQPLGK